MSEARKTGWQIVVGLVLLVLAPFVVYVAGYLAMPVETFDLPYNMALGQERLRTRVYDAAWKKSLYYPATRVEAWLIGMNVEATHMKVYRAPRNSWDSP